VAVVATVLAAAVIVAIVVAAPGGHGRRHAVTVPTTPTTPTTEAARPARPAPAGEAFGISVNRLFNDLSYTQPQINAQLAAVRATGATVARSDALWEAAEPRAPVGEVHHYVWTFDDQIAGSLAAQGLTWLPIIDYTASWAESISGQDHSPPRSDAEYAAYAAAFAARYGPGGAFWRAHPGIAPTPVTTIEIWNEPDNAQFWPPTPNAAAYAALYLAARTAIDAVSPQIRVIVGGLTDPAAFLPAMVQAEPELAGHVDGVAIHPYGRPAVVVAKVRTARATLDGLGMASVPLYVTEFGWTTDPPTAPDYAPAAQRPADILAALTALGHLNCGIAAALLYTWVTPQRDPADSQDWYGIANPADPAAGTADTAAFTAGVAAAARPAAASAPCAG
jgi:hypothetical protein